ncbi:39S ribosomal protein L22, mitochondrial [Folsomia candida]|uniref:Large ribosomal subunit protein uL22m n=1 Tax=Folsomia candida TaxID=158441 RepID=A0A226DKU2_FOLCA|nr:39S ribosomal protein L22, mitochondrial [Folsomia candida]OXA45740.1 hypothetical protein Fcan01_19748 [Folsomia candida]
MIRNLAKRCSMIYNGLGSIVVTPSILAPRMISTSVPTLMPYEHQRGPKDWPRYNKKIFPPQEIGEKPRPAYVCHMKCDIKYSPDKMWWVACLVRGMPVDEAVKQLCYVKRKGAGYVKQVILEAQALAVRDHNVEFKSNLWVAESFASKGYVVKGVRRHARKRFGLVEYKHCHYYVRLEEGPPPENYYLPNQPDGPTLLQRWIEGRRQLRVAGAL